MAFSTTVLRIGALGMMAALAGCQSYSPPRMVARSVVPAPQMQQSGVDGEWASTDGLSISRFTNGSFQTLATDTGNLLAEGSYSYSDPSSVQISMTSLIRQTNSRVNCALISPTQMNCTSDSGNQFVLVRRQGFS